MSPTLDRPANVPTTSGTGVLLRLVWLLGANAAILLMATYIALSTDGSPSWIDGAIWAVAAVAIGARWLDVTQYGGTTADGTPATKTDWARWAFRLVAFAGASNVIAHLLARH